MAAYDKVCIMIMNLGLLSGHYDVAWRKAEIRAVVWRKAEIRAVVWRKVKISFANVVTLVSGIIVKLLLVSRIYYHSLSNPSLVHNHIDPITLHVGHI